MFYTYILYSEKVDKFYVGMTSNLEERMRKHNSKNKGFTNQADDWKHVFVEEFVIKEEALSREKEIKNWKSRKKIIELIQK